MPKTQLFKKDDIVQPKKGRKSSKGYMFKQGDTFIVLSSSYPAWHSDPHRQVIMRHLKNGEEYRVYNDSIEKIQDYEENYEIF